MKATRTNASAALSKLRWIVAVRQNVRQWFQGFGHFCDERTRLPMRGRPNVLQRRMFAYYQWCCEHDKPCRMVVLKYRRAGSSTASAAILYTHAQNYHARLGVIGTDYKASSNMLAMVEHFGRHDHFPGWDTNHDVWSEAERSAPETAEVVAEVLAVAGALGRVNPGRMWAAQTTIGPAVAGGANQSQLPQTVGDAVSVPVTSSDVWSENLSHVPQPVGAAASGPTTSSDVWSENQPHVPPPVGAAASGP
ncbi:MAG TPA: hypothetical protein VGJ21_01495, partial [Terracidiphilus sp.]